MTRATTPQKHRRLRPQRQGIRYGPAFSQTDACPTCGCLYHQFRTGMTYSDVRAEFWSYDEDRTRWRNKRRGTVLGRWHQIKLALWDLHRAHCVVNDDDVPF